VAWSESTPSSAVKLCIDTWQYYIKIWHCRNGNFHGHKLWKIKTEGARDVTTRRISSVPDFWRKCYQEWSPYAPPQRCWCNLELDKVPPRCASGYSSVVSHNLKVLQEKVCFLWWWQKIQQEEGFDIRRRHALLFCSQRLCNKLLYNTHTSFGVACSYIANGINDTMLIYYRQGSSKCSKGRTRMSKQTTNYSIRNYKHRLRLLRTSTSRPLSF